MSNTRPRGWLPERVPASAPANRPRRSRTEPPVSGIDSSRPLIPARRSQCTPSSQPHAASTSGQDVVYPHAETDDHGPAQITHPRMPVVGAGPDAPPTATSGQATGSDPLAAGEPMEFTRRNLPDATPMRSWLDRRHTTMATQHPLDTIASEEIVVREGTRRDHDAIRTVIIAAYRQYEPVVGIEFYTRYLADLTDLDRHASLGRIIVAEIDNTIVGSGVFHADTSVQQFGWPRGWAGGRGLAVHPSQRRSGVARTLLAAAEQMARDRGAPVFAFHTVSFMSHAVALYQRLGFRRDPEHDQDLTRHLGLATRPPVRAIAYRRDLAQPTNTALPHHPRSAALLRCRPAHTNLPA
jgi:GNAT superfamily N-acetyltransferase